MIFLFVLFSVEGFAHKEDLFIYYFFPKAFYLAKININYFVSKTLCKHKHAVTRSPEESPVESKSQLKFLSEPCWIFATWLLVGVTRLQNSDLKGRKAWGSVHLAVQVAAHQTKEHHQRCILNPITPCKWSCKSSLHWLSSIELYSLLSLPGLHLD